VNLLISEPWHEIVPGLWMGGNRDEPRYDKFHAVLSLDWGGSADITDKDIERHDWYFQDGPMPGEYELDKAVQWAWRQWILGKPTLVRCQAGLNRSGLVIARILIDNGMPPQEAIDLIREQRSPNALFNPAFTKYLLLIA
jgi:hypothetical protein